MLSIAVTTAGTERWSMCKGDTEYVFPISAIQLHYMPSVSTVILKIVIVCACILVSHASTKIQTQTIISNKYPSAHTW